MKRKNKLTREGLIVAHIVLTPLMFIGGFVLLFFLMIILFGLFSFFEKYGDYGYAIILIISLVIMFLATLSYYIGLVIYYKRKRLKKEKDENFTPDE